MQAVGQGVPVPGGAPPMSMAMSRQRPDGVAILAILEMLGGVLIIIGGILTFSILAVAGTAIGADFGILAGVLGGALGGILLIIGLIGVLLGYGLWNGKGWAWTLTLIFSVLGLLGSLAALPGGIVGLLIEGAILHYVTRPHVRQYFGK